MKKISLFTILTFFLLTQNAFSFDISNLYFCVHEIHSYFRSETQDDLGNTYMGLYTQGDGTELCAYVFKKDTNGKISIVYHDYARHIHTIAFNPINKKLYLSQGDDIPWLPQTKGQGKLLSSDDYGETRKVIHQHPRANYIPILFDSKGCVIVGEDQAQNNPSSRLMRSCDDRRFHTLITLSGDESANRRSRYQTGSNIFLGTVIDTVGKVPTLRKSTDDGKTRSRIHRKEDARNKRDGYHDIRYVNGEGISFLYGNTKKTHKALYQLKP